DRRSETSRHRRQAAAAGPFPVHPTMRPRSADGTSLADEPSRAALPHQRSTDDAAAAVATAAGATEYHPLISLPSPLMAALSVLETLAARPLVRRMTDVVMGRLAAHRTAQLDQRSPAQLQRQTLLRLVHHARRTRFGVDYDFDSIRTVADYQRRVPLR